MDPAHIFRQGLESGPSRPNQAHVAWPPRPRPPRYDLLDVDGFSRRVAHTLTACCRCRQRKTRCDPNLPRCLPCERSDSICEYFDPAKGRIINRYYVVQLQDTVRTLEAELAQYTNDESDYPCSNEDIVRPGGLIRVHASDETPRYLGPSSGIAMTRLLMEEAKRYTESHRISDLIPEVRDRGQARMQFVQMTGPATNTRKKSYPMISERPAETLPKRETADKLVEVYKQKSQLLWPVLDETDLNRDLAAVFDGDKDPYKNFMIRMIIAISLQQLGVLYAGLADSYYVAAMQYAETLIRPKDLRSLQCLILIGQYSLLTPTRTPFYYVIGLATRICLQEGLANEKMIGTGYSSDPRTVDMRRRLVWIVATIESGLSYQMGRPSGFASSDESIDVGFFANVDDENIGPHGIRPGPPSERKLVAIHLYKAAQLQAEIRRVLYQKKRAEPKNEAHPWYNGMEKKMRTWLDESPADPQGLRPWLQSRYHQMRISLFRPSPQVPLPSPQAAGVCFESSALVLQQARKQIDGGILPITWAFLLTLNDALNALLWATSYPEVRLAHARAEVEELVSLSLLCLDRCAERWPGTTHTSQLYAIIAKACLQSFESVAAGDQALLFSLASPRSVADGQSSPDPFSQTASPHPGRRQQQQQQQQQPPPPPPPSLNPPQFSLIFDSDAESMKTCAFDPNFPSQPTFRSNSIFCNPASESTGRRFSYFPPDCTQSGDGVFDTSVASTDKPEPPSPPVQSSSQLLTPPESLPTGGLSTATLRTAFSPPTLPQASALSDASADSGPMSSPQASTTPPHKFMPSQNAQALSFGTSRPFQAAPVQQRSLPTVAGPEDWFSPPALFISPYNFGPMGGSFFNDAMANSFSEPAPTGLGLPNASMGLDAPTSLSLRPPNRQDSLTQSQQLELMNVLETEGVGDIDAFLSGGSGGLATDERWY